MLQIRFILLLLFASCTGSVLAQALEGRVVDQNGDPVPYANLFIPEISDGTSANGEGEYFLKFPHRGEYRVITTAVGYASRTDSLVISDGRQTLSIELKEASALLDEVVVKASKRDSAYYIMQQAAKRRKDYLKSAASWRAQVYLKAREDIDRIEKKKKKEKERVSAEVEEDPIVALERERTAAENKLLQSLNLIESQIQLNFQAPGQYKEERLAFKAYGDKSGLFVPTFGDGDGNFYRAQVNFGSLAENTFISPLNSTAVLSYKFKLLSSTVEKGRTVYKIRVTPRKKGNGTLSGTIWINKGLFNINKLSLKLPRGGLKVFDQLTVEQNYTEVADSFWLPTRQVLSYETKQGKRATYAGKTTIRFYDFELDFPFPDKFFGGELAVTSAEAYERDTTYWSDVRLEPLTAKEDSVVQIRDSIYARVNSTAYKDSMQALYNKITFLDLAWDGVGFRNHRRNSHLYIGSLAAMLEFEIIGGWRFGPYSSYYRRFDNGRSVFTSASLNVGFNLGDVLGSGLVNYLYDPMRRATVYGGIARNYEAINPFQAFLAQFRRSNYVQTDSWTLGHKFDLANGLVLETEITSADRQTAPGGADSETVFNELFEDDRPIVFEPYQSVFSKIAIGFTPFEKYITEPTQKIVVGSKWPTFYLAHQKGWNDLLGSDIDFDFFSFRVDQRLQLVAFGNSRYSAQVGTYTNARDLRFVDIKRFPQSNPILYSDPLNSFQLLDSGYVTSRPFFEFHGIHHFNGALINNIPLIKLTRLEVVAGANLLYLTENKLRHEEVYAGVERVFKLGPRRRLRLGSYYVLANSSVTSPQTELKFSIDLIDTWKSDWSF